MGLGRFPPISATLVEEKYGNTVSRHLDTLQSKLAGYNLSEEERKETETALDQLLFMTITFFDEIDILVRTRRDSPRKAIPFQS